MPRITFVDKSGATHDVDVKAGLTVMEAAVNASVPGILAECGGACACATCHVYIEADDNRVPAASDAEAAMAAEAIDSNKESRLACQITVTPEMDGLRVRIPDRQV